MGKEQKEVWVDAIKIFACILVVLGHFFQSMTKSEIMSSNGVYLWFNQTIYFFHVELFFICSGYLYQRYSVVNSWSTWKANVLKKALTLGIPYFCFSLFTWLLKSLFSGAVNSEVGGLFSCLFVQPLSPYWYLYGLFLLFFLIPTFRSKKTMMLIIMAALLLKLVHILWANGWFFPISSIMENAIWFTAGMCLATQKFPGSLGQKYGKVIAGILLIIFVVISISFRNGYFMGFDFLAGVIACGAVLIGITVIPIEGCFKNLVIWGAKYTMPIFLMHTIFAAPTRVILLKLEVDNVGIHILLGILISFAGPIMAAKIASYFPWMNFWIYPTKYIRLERCEK